LSFLLLPIQYSLTFICYGFIDSITFQDELDRLKPKLDKVFKENMDLVQEMKDRLENQLGTDIDGEGDFEPVTDQEQVISNLQMQVESALQVFNRALTTFKLEGEVTQIGVITICVALDHSIVIFQKEGGCTYIKSLVCKTPIVKVDRNKYLTLNRCP
jgi:hypothetical protein